MLVLSALPPTVAAHAAAAVACAHEQPAALLVADMSRPSFQPRLWVIDLRDRQHPEVVLKTRVAHGYGSDPGNTGWASRFGDTEGSGMTSLGLYRIASPYVGKHGPSYRLAGLSTSDAHAFERNIMLHPADYVGPQHVGRSAGCAAVAPSALATMTAHFGTLTGGLLWIDGPGVTAPMCKALLWPTGWALPKGSVWAKATQSARVCDGKA